jgi:hypothetical protein
MGYVWTDLGGGLCVWGREIRWRREGVRWGIILAAEEAEMQIDF